MRSKVRLGVWLLRITSWEGESLGRKGAGAPVSHLGQGPLHSIGRVRDSLLCNKKDLFGKKECSLWPVLLGREEDLPVPGIIRQT